jgi:hypothetical protein
VYVYKQTSFDADCKLWTVGFYAPDGKWEAESDHSAADAAAQRVAWLNGSSLCISATKDWQKVK